MPIRLGIDEAGRGCVLGPLVFGACLIEESDEPTLRDMGVRDSKKLTKDKRNDLKGRIPDVAIRWETVAIEPAVIDAENLGIIGKRVIVDLAARLKPDVLVLDAPVQPSGIPNYVKDIRERLAAVGVMEIEIIAENGADDTYMCCAAASVFAKTTRDERLQGIELEAGVPLGSGYPGDPKTTHFLRDHWTRERKWPSFVRTKWDTCRRIVAESAQGQLFS